MIRKLLCFFQKGRFILSIFKVYVYFLLKAITQSILGQNQHLASVERESPSESDGGSQGVCYAVSLVMRHKHTLSVRPKTKYKLDNIWKNNILLLTKHNISLQSPKKCICICVLNSKDFAWWRQGGNI